MYKYRVLEITSYQLDFGDMKKYISPTFRQSQAAAG